MALATIKNNKITKKQRIAFYQFILNIYTLDIETLRVKYSRLSVDTIENLQYYGFCYMIYEYFGLLIGGNDDMMNSLFPELYKYKPAVVYGGWWFVLGGEQTERIKITRNILTSLQ
jgi:hypothetical protein